MRTVLQRRSYRRLIAKSLATARPTGRLGGFPTGRPWVFASRSCSRRPAERFIRASEDTRVDRSFPDPFLGSRALRLPLPAGSGAVGSDAPLVGGLSPRGRGCVTGGDINPTCHGAFLTPISSGWPCRWPPTSAVPAIPCFARSSLSWKPDSVSGAFSFFAVHFRARRRGGIYPMLKKSR